MKTVSDFHLTGKLYPKIDSYFDNQYIGSSRQFQTTKKYKAWLAENLGYCPGRLSFTRREQS